MISGFFVQSVVFGLIAIAVYGICTLIFRIHSRITFALAFISLITVVALLLVKQNVALASNFATYTFLLLVLGVIALSIEARPRVRKKRRRGR
jgi:ABC-type branched-subunit amino acid transport system ATPase component